MRDDRPELLIAEDDGEIRNLIHQRLQAAGYKIRLARTGSEVIAALQIWPVAGVVLDINMPEVDGFGVLAARSTFRNDPPVLMLTARQASGDVKRALKLGASDYLTKPFSETQLLERVKRLLRRARPSISG